MSVKSQESVNLPMIVGLLFLPPLVTFGFGFNHAAVVAIFISIIGLWLTEAIPLPVTGLLVPVLATLYGVLPATSAFDSFGSDILFLFLGCFLMGRSMEKHGFDKRLAYFLLGRFMPSSTFFGINLILALTSFVLSMWISNTSATAVLSAVTVGVLVSLESYFPDEITRKRATVRLLLTCAFAASIGGLATPVGSPPNLIALKMLEQKGISISFFDWLKLALPISLCMLVSMLVLFELVLPLRSLKFPGIRKHFAGLLRDLGPMKCGERQISLVFVVVILLWVVPGVLVSFFPGVSLVALLNSRLSMGLVGLSGGILTFLLPIRDQGTGEPNLSWVETRSVDWGTLMMFGGGLTLGLILEQSGAASDIGSRLFSGEHSSIFLLGVSVVVVSIVMSEFASNTAAASILIPLILGAAASLGMSEEVSTSVVLAATFAASFGFMLPVSTPPNAIVYGTGLVPAKDMRTVGFLFDIVGAIIIIVFIVLPLI